MGGAGHARWRASADAHAVRRRTTRPPGTSSLSSVRMDSVSVVSQDVEGIGPQQGDDEDLRGKERGTWGEMGLG